MSELKQPLWLQLPDLVGLKQKEIEELCHPVTIAEKDAIQLSNGDWKDSNGVRFLTQPVKVATSKWREFTTNCASIVAGEKGSGDVFVFAYTFREEDSGLLSEFFLEHQLRKKGYRILDGELSI